MKSIHVKCYKLNCVNGPIHVVGLNRNHVTLSKKAANDFGRQPASYLICVDESTLSETFLQNILMFYGILTKRFSFNLK